MSKAREFVRMLGQLATFGVDPATLASKLSSMFGLVAKIGDTNALGTTDKTVVGGINEIRAAIAAGYGGGAMSATRVISERTATAGQTSFSALAYVVGNLEVFRNGFRLPGASFTATTGTTVVLADPCKLNDEIIFVAYNIVSTQGKHLIPVNAGAMTPALTNGPTAFAGVASASNQPDIWSINFSATVEQYAWFSLVLPKKWNRGTVTARFRWSHAATSNNFGVVWGIHALAVSDNELISQVLGNPVLVTDTGGVTNRFYVSPETTAITIAGTPADGDTVWFRVYRKAADAADTLTIVARLMGVDLFVTTNAETDA